MNIHIIGGGMMGVSLGYFLAQAGVRVELFEASDGLGGAVGAFALDDGTRVDRFYHALLSSDSRLIELCQELGIADRLRFAETKTGFYYHGRLHSMNNILEFLRFPPLGWIDRLRLGLTIAYAQMLADWQPLEKISVEQWLLRWSGKTVFENIWRPLLRAKFDGDLMRDVPATWVWARLVRMKSARRGLNQKEMVGHLIGGYTTLVDAMARQIEAAGGVIHRNSRVSEIALDSGRATGVRVGNHQHPCDAVISTLPTPAFRDLIPEHLPDYRRLLDATQYLGIVCPLLVMDRPVTGFWTLNITDEFTPFTGIIETTTYIDPQFVGGHYLVYLPKYTAPASRWLTVSDEEILATWLQNLETMFPQFERRWIREAHVHRERYVEPLHKPGVAAPGLETPVAGLYLANTAQIYPALTNCESVSRHARDLADRILTRSSVAAS